MTNTPPGWYPDSENPGQQRYWDGSAWTEHRHPALSSVPGTGGHSNGSDGRPWFKKKRFVIPLGVFAFLVIVGVVGGGGAETGTPDERTAATSDAGSADSGSREADEDAGVTPDESEPSVSQEPTVSANAADMIKEFQDN